METKTKLVWLEAVGGILGWVWIFASIAAVYFLAAALFFSGSWSSFFWAVGVSIIAKWLARGFRDNQIRVGFVAELMAKGLSSEEANEEWAKRYMGKKA